MRRALIFACLFAGCSSAVEDNNNEVDAGTAPPDAAAADAEPVDSGAPPTACEVWCAEALECKTNVVRENVGMPFGETVECRSARTSATIEGCVANCEANNSAATPRCDDTPRPRPEDVICWPANLPDPVAACEVPAELTYVYAELLDRERGGEYTISSTASLTRDGPDAQLTLADQRIVQVNSVALSIPIALGEVVGVELSFECSFWCESKIIVRRLDGTLVLAAWAGHPDYVPAIPEVDLAYQLSPCSSGQDRCSGLLYADLVATFDSSAPLILRPGQSAEHNDYLVVNSRAFKRFALGCTDTPSMTLHGAIILR